MPTASGYEPTQVRLSSDALAILMAILRELFGAPEEPDLAALRDLMRETLLPELQPVVK
jgi:hypothetical protein